MERLQHFCTRQSTVVGILNNRQDREQRAYQFADIATYDLKFDRLVTFGAYEKNVTARLKANGYPEDQIVNLGEQRNPSSDEIVDQIILAMPTRHVFLVGLVNIHTEQAENLLHFIEGISEKSQATVNPQRPVANVAVAQLGDLKDFLYGNESRPSSQTEDISVQPLKEENSDSAKDWEEKTVSVPPS